MALLTFGSSKQLLRGKGTHQDNLPQLSLKSQAKRLLVTSDISFLERGEQDLADVYNPSSILPNLNSVELDPLPITPPNQKIPVNASPCKLMTPNISNTHMSKPTAKNPPSSNLLATSSSSIVPPPNPNATFAKLRPKKKGIAKK
jgi:hypothetical protein